MHVYLREEPVRLRMEEVQADGIVPDDADLIPIAFFGEGNSQPSFRSLLPQETVDVLRQALQQPVTLGVLAEEPEEATEEIRAMVGIAIAITGTEMEAEPEEAPAEPWRASVGNPEAWRGGDEDPAADGTSDTPRTALLAFAPLVRLARKFPLDFGEELADLLESALSGATRPALEARVDRMLGDL